MRDTGNLVSPYTNRTPYQRVRLCCAARPYRLPAFYHIVKTLELHTISVPGGLPVTHRLGGKPGVPQAHRAYQANRGAQRNGRSVVFSPANSEKSPSFGAGPVGFHMTKVAFFEKKER
jgi:hypothetical protein